MEIELRDQENSEVLRKFHERNNKFLGKNNVTNNSYYIILGLTFAYFFVELVISVSTGSVTLLSDAFHMLGDIIALIIAIYAKRKATESISNTATFGYARAVIVGALVNSVFLMACCMFILIEVADKLATYKQSTIREDFSLIIWVAVGGIVINIIGLCMFHDHGHGHGHGDEDCSDHSSHDHDKKESKSKDLNDASAYEHIVSDFLGSLMVIISTVIIKYVSDDRIFILDPLCSLIVVFLIVKRNIGILRSSVTILMHIVPSKFSTTNIIEEIKKLVGVVEIHQFRLWQLDETQTECSFHLTSNSDNNVLLLDDIKKCLHAFDIHESTIQFENIHVSNTNNLCSDIVCGEENC